GRIQNPLLKSLFAYWQSLGAKDGAAQKRYFDPLDLPAKVLPRIFMIDVDDTAPLYRFRLLGTYLVEAHGHDYTGCALTDSEVPGFSQSKTMELLEILNKNSEPQHYRGPTQFSWTRRFGGHEQIILPLMDAEGRISVVVGAIDYLGF